MRALLAPYDLREVVVTVDALHTQTGTAVWLRDQGAHYLMMVKRNQPGLLKALKTLPWKNIPPLAWSDRGHGRRVHRRIKVITAPAWITFPGLAQIAQVKRTRSRRTSQGNTTRTTETVYLLCSLPVCQAHPSQIATWLQGHWRIEALHWIRDVTYNEDRHHLHTGNTPQVMATLRNLAISLIRLTHDPNTSITTRLRHHTRHPDQATKLLVTPP